jgi:CRP-like cAMP-binding protein
MSRNEPGFDGGTKTALPGSEIRGGVSRTTPEVHFRDNAIPNQGLTNKILASLPAPDFKRLMPFFEPVGLVKGTDLVGVNEFDGFVYFPESAVISHLYLLTDGGATAAAVIGSEGVVGISTMFESRPPVYRARVMIEGEGLRVKAGVIKGEFARGEGFQRLILSYMSKRLRQISQRAVCNGRHRLLERLCTWLLMVDDRSENSALALTHADIANHLGARRSVVSGCCNTLREKKVIDYRRGHLTILDRTMLGAAACECYQVLKPELSSK